MRCIRALNVGAANTTRESDLVLVSTNSEKNAGEGWTWDAGTCTLTLDNFTLDQSGLSRAETSCAIAIGAPDDSMIDVTIVLKGENKDRIRQARREPKTIAVDFLFSAIAKSSEMRTAP